MRKIYIYTNSTTLITIATFQISNSTAKYGHRYVLLYYMYISPPVYKQKLLDRHTAYWNHVNKRIATEIVTRCCLMIKDDYIVGVTIVGLLFVRHCLLVVKGDTIAWVFYMLIHIDIFSAHLPNVILKTRFLGNLLVNVYN